MAKDTNDLDYGSITGAWEIAQKFADVEAKNAESLYSFDNSLPYKKDIIALALLNLLTSNDFRNELLRKGEEGEKILQTISSLMFSLATAYFPDEMEYQELIETKKLMD